MEILFHRLEALFFCIKTMKKNQTKILLFLLFVLALVPVADAQDAQFSQFYSSPLTMGPSYAGTGDGGRIIMNYRDQWPQLAATFVTYAISADYYLEEYRSGIGVVILRDDAGKGLLNVTNLGLNYSFNFDINRDWKLRPGLQAYYYIKAVDISSLLFGDQIVRSSNYDPGSTVEDINAESIGHFDFSSSLLAYSDKFWFGFTVDHLMTLSPHLSATGDYIPLRVSVYGGGKYEIYGRTRRVKEENITGAFNLLIQDKYKYLDLGMYYVKAPLIFGLWYRGLPVFPENRTLGALSLLVGYKINAYKIGYSYDFTTSRLITQTGGAHEVSLIYSFGAKKRRLVKHKFVPCPIF